MGAEGRLISSAGLSPRSTTRYLFLVLLIILIFTPLYNIARQDAKAAYYQNYRYLYDKVTKYLDNGVYNNTLYQSGTEDAVHSQWNFSEPCARFPNTDGILLVMKTGATEAFDKMPTQLLTSLQCLPDFLLFSDLEQQIGKYHVYDALDRVHDTIKTIHPEFQLYDAQASCPISQKECTEGGKSAWNLDKYKFLNMIVRTWEMRPDLEWYVFAEADTYIVWSNLVTWLRERADPAEELYVGSVAQLRGFPFAHGGSGYVMSGALVKRLVESRPNVGAQFDTIAHKVCCGDVLVASALDNIGVPVHQALPMFNGEKPNTLPYGPQWCEPLITMHHVNSEEVSALWQYEQTRTSNEPILIKDMYDAFFSPHLIPQRSNWDNAANDVAYIGPDKVSQDKASALDKKRQKLENSKNVVERQAHKSADACARVCEASGLAVDAEKFFNLDSTNERIDFLRVQYKNRRSEPDFAKRRSCFQWRYHNGICYTGKSFRLGKPRVSDDGEWTSGWFVEGIQDWIATSGQCEKPRWTPLLCYGKGCHKEPVVQ